MSSEGNPVMTYDAFLDCPRRISGIPGVAVRLGLALENWGRRAARPTDRETLRRDHDRRRDNEARMLASQRLADQNRKFA